MNIVLWILQGVLALLLFAGGATKIFKIEELAKAPAMSALPLAVWRGIGALEVLCAVLLILPAALKWMPGLTPLAAAVIAVESLALSALYGKYSLEISATNPLVFSAAMAVMALFIAYGRYAATN